MNHSADREMEVFTEAIQLPPAGRAAYLERACAGDALLRQRVEALLQTYDQVGDFLEQTPARPTPPPKVDPLATEKPGDRIGRYKLLQQIGEGGGGVVYMAEQEEPVRRRVALKIIKPGMDTKSVIARFEAERQALAMMDHPNIAKVFDAGATQSGRPYFVMELIRGIKITDYCDQHALTTEARLNLFIQVCHAVQHAHQKGIIHRDIKPSNILITSTLGGAPLPVVIDFGIAKATTNQRLTDKTLFTAFEMLIGTPAYMSPEQAALTGVDVDTRTDIYSLGVLLYELLTGFTPFDPKELQRAGLDELRRRIREQDPVSPSTRLSKMTVPDLTTVAQRRQSEAPKLIRAIHGDLDWIAMKALEKDRTRRYETANGLGLDVQRYLANEAISARPPSTLYKFQKTFLRNKILFGGAGIIALLLVVSLIAVTASLAKERRSRRLAEVAAVKSQEITQFLEDMLQGVGPSVALGRDTTMLRDILDHTSDRIGQELTNQPAIEAQLRNLIGRVYFEITSYDQAEKMQREALDLDRQLYGRESTNAAEALNDLGLVFWKQGKQPEAESAHREALEIRRRLLGDESPSVAESLDNLANVYRHYNRPTEAEPLVREALAIQQKLPGDNTLAIADSKRILSIVLGDERKMTEAESMTREVLAMREKKLGPEHPLIAASLNDVAWACGFNGKRDEAESLQRQALAMQRRLYGNDNSVVAATLSALGERVRQRGDFAEAESNLTTALALQRKFLGDQSPDYLYTLDSLGFTLEQRGRWAEAEAAHRETMTGWRRRGGVHYVWALAEAEGLVRALSAEKKYDDAEQVLAEILTPDFVQQKAAAGLLACRVEIRGRRAQWAGAAADAQLVLPLQPDEQYHYLRLAALLVATHDRAGYEKLCRQMLAVFTNISSPYVADRVAKNCLLLPHSGANLQLADQLADLAVTAGGEQLALPYFHTCKAMAQYRLGHFPEAIDWAKKTLNSPANNAKANAYAVLALAYWQLGQKDIAGQMLARGNMLNQATSPDGKDIDLGEAWLSWLFARLWLDQAAAVIEPRATVNNSLNPL